jgi:hypothetical protein
MIHIFLLNCKHDIENNGYLEIGEPMKTLLKYSILKIALFHVSNLVHCIFDRINIFEIQDDWN